LLSPHGAVQLRNNSVAVSSVHGTRSGRSLILILSSLGSRSRSSMAVRRCVRMPVLDGMSSSSVSVHVHDTHLHGNLSLVDESGIGSSDVGGRIECLVLGCHHAHSGHTHTSHSGHSSHAHSGHAHAIAVELVLHQLRVDGDGHSLRVVGSCCATGSRRRDSRAGR